MEFSVLCNYYSYVVGGDFNMWFSCTCLRPDLLEKMNSLSPDEGVTLWQKKVLFALHWGDCRLSYRGSGRIVFDGHEFLSRALPDGSVEVKFNSDCVFSVREEDVIKYA